jgi:RNA polymerase sigma factor (TIGR02999 family)
MHVPRHAVTRLLEQANAGDEHALASLLPLVYAELHAMAARSMRAERSAHTLRPTALVHEAYLRLVDQRSDWHGRDHFFAIAAQAMRRVLVDYARSHHASKRGPAAKVGLDEAGDPRLERDLPLEDVLAIHEALERLETLDALEARIVELRYFAGLTIEETAGALNLSPATVKREWTIAKAWLHRVLSEGRPHDE